MEDSDDNRNKERNRNNGNDNRQNDNRREREKIGNYRGEQDQSNYNTRHHIYANQGQGTYGPGYPYNEGLRNQLWQSDLGQQQQPQRFYGQTGNEGKWTDNSQRRTQLSRWGERIQADYPDLHRMSNEAQQNQQNSQDKQQAPNSRQNTEGKYDYPKMPGGYPEQGQAPQTGSHQKTPQLSRNEETAKKSKNSHNGDDKNK